MNSENNQNGFKTTEIGLLPEYWDVVKLHESFNFARKPKNIDIKNYDKIPFIPMEYIPSEEIYSSKIEMKKSDEIRTGTFFNDGDLLVAKITPSFENGKQCIAKDLPNRFGYATTEVWPIQNTKNSNIIFLFFYLKKSDIRINIAGKMEGSTGRQRIPKHVLSNLKIPLPPLSEQKKIAAVLSAVQEAREKTEAVIAAAKELKKSLMKYLFTFGPVPMAEVDKVRLKETEIGVVPEEWQIVNLENLVEIKGGKRLLKGHSFSNSITPYPYIRVTDFSNWTVDLSNLKYLKSEDRNHLSRYIISSNDVYISIAGTIGIVGTIPKSLEGANLTENAARLIIQDTNKLQKNYLICFLASHLGQQEIKKRTSKTSQPKLALARIKQIPIALPNLLIQRTISNMMTKLNQKIESEQSKKQALDQLFKSLLNNLMTGKIKVNHLDIE